MDFVRDADKQIYSDLALRLGKIVIQYENLKTTEKKYTGSLYIAILQNLLTNMYQKISNKKIKKMFKEMFDAPLSDDTIWGISIKNVKINSTDEQITLSKFIENVRDALSHPNALNIGSEFTPTGYITISDSSNIIEKFYFISSPDLNNKGNFKQNKTEELAMNFIKTKFKDAAVKYEPIILENGSFAVRLVGHDKPLNRQVKIEMRVSELREFLMNLANFLAQPTQADWDGKTIKNLLI